MPLQLVMRMMAMQWQVVQVCGTVAQYFLEG
jgi:hypothetical protein